MYDCTRFYINGKWKNGTHGEVHNFINPATEKPAGKVAYGTPADVDAAVAAARSAFDGFARWSVDERLDLLSAIADVYKTRWSEIAAAITAEMGAPSELSMSSQTGSGLSHLRATMDALREFKLTEPCGDSLLIREPIGVCGLITPWNWPINQIVCKVAPALAAGCTVILKPSEIAPADATIFAEVMHEAGAPPGVFNLVHGDGPGVGSALSAHPGIDMISFTGSTRAGILVAKSAANSVKRVAQELGGKSPNIILPSAPLEEAVSEGVHAMFENTGQSCNAPSRMLVTESRYEEAVSIAATVADATRAGDPNDPDTQIGPVISATQFRRIQKLIKMGIEEGARVAAGGPGKPHGLDTGYYVKPTVFRDVDNSMAIAREEIFGPVLCLIPYRTVEQAVQIANDTDYGLSSYVWAGEKQEALAVAQQLRAGMVHLNGAPNDVSAPFGGYRQSGNGREWGLHGIADFMEVKAVMGA